jgi:hypothetical protein
MPVRKPQPEVAFLAAALALLGAPVLMLAGLVAFGLAARVLTPLDRLLNGPLLRPLVLAWAVLVVVVILMLGVRLSRRVTRS